MWEMQDNCYGDECKDEEQEMCPHCEGNHHAGSTKCHQRIKEMKENKIRAEMSLSHAEAAERIERNDEMVAVQKEPEQKTSRVSTKRDV